VSARERFEQLAALAPHAIGIEPARLAAGAGAWAAGGHAPGPLTVAELGRGLDARWRRTSYSDMTAGAYEAMVDSEPEEQLVQDEPESPAAAEVEAASVDAAAGALTGIPSPLAQAPGGVSFGTLVHHVLEATDFDAADLDAELTTRLEAALARRPLDVGDPVALRAGLRAAIEAPLLDGVALRDLRRFDRLDELGFELPLAGGEHPSGELTLDAVADALRTHLPAGDPLAGYAERLSDPALRRDVRGYLTGTIDLVARIGERYAIVDYKTNWLGPAETELTLWHYRPAALAAEMLHSHYGLQAILYAAALHRYLRWRLPGYDPDRHFAGVHYLFLRGAPGGGFSWHPPGRLVSALSDALDGRAG
jgi:exodeoxyribonuclease V beta subunit